VVLSNFSFFVLGRRTADGLSSRCSAGVPFTVKLLPLEDVVLLDEDFFDLTKILGKYTVQKHAWSLFVGVQLKWTPLYQVKTTLTYCKF